MRWVKGFYVSLLVWMSAPSFADPAVLAAAQEAITRGQGREALRLLRPLAQKGDRDASYWLGRLYFYDVPGVPRNDRRAAQWFARAARDGHRDAQYKLGGLYYLGRGVERSLPLAIAWWREAARQGQPEALNNLGAMLATGQGIAADPELGLALEIVAARLGSEAAAENIAWKERSEAVIRLAERFIAEPSQLADRLDRLPIEKLP